MSNFIRKLGQLISSCDWFAAPILLRFHGEESKKTKTGGFVSLFLIVFLASAFSSSWVNALKKKQIKCETEIIRQGTPSQLSISSSNFMLAIGSTEINILNQNTSQYFSVEAFKIKRQYGIQVFSQKFALVPCSISHFSQFQIQYQKIYHQYGLQNYLCLPVDFAMIIQGKFVSQQFQYLSVFVKYCRDQINCKGSNLTQLRYKINFFFINTLLNPTLHEPISFYLQDRYQNTLNNQISLETNIYLSQYVVETDESLRPIQDISKASGYFVDRTQKEEFVRSALYTDYAARVYFRKSDQKLKISRVYRKLDDVLSYLGGLFGIMAAFFGFFITNYNKRCYELQMANKIFRNEHKDNQKQIKNDVTQIRQAVHCTKGTLIDSSLSESIKFNFWTYIKFNFSKIYFSFFNANSWPSMYSIHQKLEQTQNQMNIDTILQKIFFYQRAFECMFNESQLTLLMLQQKMSIKQIRERRMIMNFEDEDFIKQEQQETKQGKQNQQTVHQKDDNVMMAIYESIMQVERQANDGDELSMKILHGVQKDIMEKYESYKIRSKEKSYQKRKTAISRFQVSMKKIMTGKIINQLNSKVMFEQVQPSQKTGLLRVQDYDRSANFLNSVSRLSSIRLQGQQIIQ